MKTAAEFETALAKFLADVNAHREKIYAADGAPDWAHEKVGEDRHRGAKYVRIVSSGGSSRYVFCFIEIATGDVLKAKGWAGPTKGVRGSIFAETFEGYGVSQYGANYAR